MSCTSCSSGKDGTPSGCQNNGSCGTGGCNKLNVYNWLSDMSLPSGQNPFNIVEVRFKGTRKEFYKNTENLPLQEGDVVAVESSPGHDIGVVSMTGELVRFQLKKKKIQQESDEIKAIYRKGKPVDIEKWQAAQALEDSTMHRARSIAQSLKLSMKISDVEFQGDMKKAAFFYTADDRVDFRELIKKLAEEFKVRIEMKQIGMRQEAGRLGGIGSCGRELCCSTWLTDFRSVSTSAARYQNLSLNPLKLAGQCGKLKCCLNYELDSYMDALKDFPDINIALHTDKGIAMHRKTDLFKRMMWYAYVSGNPRSGDKRDSEQDDTPESSNWFMMPLERVREIIDMNKQNKKPADLVDFSQIVKEPVLDFENVVGQDSITRLDHKKSKNKKKKKKKRPDGELPIGENIAPRPREAAQTEGPRPLVRQEQNRRPAPRPPRPHQEGQRQNPPASTIQTSGAEKTSNTPPRQSPGPNPRQSPRVNPRQSPSESPKTEQEQSSRPPIVQNPTPSVDEVKPPIAPRSSPGTRPPRESPKKDNTENSGV